jgi:hypothetical protein
MRRACHVLAGLVGAVLAGTALAETPVDLELVLAADVSLSMDRRELMLQRAGYADAIESPEVLEAILSGYQRAIAVTLVEWAGIGTQKVVVPWRRIGSAAEARAFAEEVRAAPIHQARRTSISAALAAAATLFDGNGYAGYRQVIDVSGDGPNNQGEPVAGVRDRLVAQGITINGLPMLLDPLPVDWYNVPDLDIYYRECVIGGFGAFYVPIRSIEAFGDAVRRKLVLEIAGTPPPARPILAQFGTGYDCLVGEKRWMQRMQTFD